MVNAKNMHGRFSLVQCCLFVVLGNRKLRKAFHPWHISVMQCVLCFNLQDVMRDPVIASDGFTYERSAIEGWLRKSNISPMTNLTLPNTSLVPNIALGQVIRCLAGRKVTVSN